MKKILFSLTLLVAAFSANAQSWTPQATNFDANFGVKKISIVDANTVWISSYDGSGGGSYPKVVAKTTDGGSNWLTYTISNIPSAALISDIAGVDANTAFVVSAPSSGTAGNGIWKTSNGGTTWTQQTAFSTASFANQIYFWDANTGWAAGDPTGSGSNAKYEMYKTSNGGTTWSVVSTAPTPLTGGEYSYVGLKDVKGDNVWIGSDLGRIFKSTDKGSTWSAAYSPVTDFGAATTEGSVGMFSFKDANNGLLIAVDDTTTATLYSTTDGGANWEQVGTNGLWYFGDIAYVPGTENTYVTTGTNYSEDSYMGSAYSTDGGVNWTSIDEGVQRGTVEFLNPTTGWAGYFSDGITATTGILKFNGDLLGIANNTVNSKLEVYPNPATDVVNFTSKKEIKAVTIFDLNGRKLNQVKDATSVNVSSLTKGVYVVQVLYADGGVENTKIIKK